MKSLRQHIRQLQFTENLAAEKAGMRFLLLEDEKLLGSRSKSYIRFYTDKLLEDITPEAVQAVKMGKELVKEITT